MSLDELREEMAFNLFLADEIRSGVWDAFVVFLRFRSEGAVVVLEQLDGIGYRKGGDPGPMVLRRESINTSAERFVSAMAALPEVGAFRRAVVVYRYFGSEYATHWEMFVDEEAEHVIVSPATWYQIAQEWDPFAEGVLEQVPLEADLPPRAVDGGGLQIAGK